MGIRFHFVLVDSLKYMEFKSAIEAAQGADINLISEADDYQTLRVHDISIEQAIAYEWEHRPKSYNLQIPAISKRFDGADIVRFRLPEGHRSSDEAPTLRASYFEVPLSEFKKLLIE